MHLRIETLIIGALLGCAAEGVDGRDWTTTRSTAGDTTVVRTTGGSAASGARTLVAEVTFGSLEAPEDHYTFGDISEMDIGPGGEIHLFDAQVPALRVYDSTGRFLRTIGRKGAGPGEYEQVNGLTVHRDGRIALWDGTTSRVNMYSPAGEFVVASLVPGRGRSFTRNGVHVDTAGFTYIRARIADPPDDPVERAARATNGLMKWDAEAKLVDSLVPPVAPLAGGRITAAVEGMSSTRTIPFAPSSSWAWNRLGWFVSVANSATYAVVLHRPMSGPLRIEREVERIPVSSEQRANEEEVATAAMRRVDPTWRWPAEPIPDVKPSIRSVATGRDGRVWVWVRQPSERIPDAEIENGEPGPDGKVPPTVQWREPTAYDVFEPDGEFLGRIFIPPRVTVLAMEGNRVWGYVRDSLDVQQATRWRVSPPLAGR